MRKYYELMGLTQMADAAIDVIDRSAADLNKSPKGFLFEARLRQVSRELGKALLGARLPHSALLYAPLHYIMLLLRMQVSAKGKAMQRRSYVIFVDIDAAVTIHSRTAAQVGFFLWYEGLVDFFSAIHPSASVSTNRARAMLFVEQYALQVNCRSPEWSRLRTYDGSRDLTYEPGLRQLEDFVSTGVPKEGAQRTRALTMFRRYVALAEEAWNWTGSNLDMRRICRDVNSLGEEVSRIHLDLGPPQ
jgi:hypothetical protein